MLVQPAREIEDLVRAAILAAQEAGGLPPFDIPQLVVERPQREEHGDYATTAALQLAGAAQMPPMRIAEVITPHIRTTDFIAQVDVAQPGFVNFTLDDGWLVRQVDEILAAGDSYGRLSLGDGQTVQVEYVSANPTGPLHVGSGRNAVIGDSLANVLEAAGYEVQREYYVNDAGTQMRAFAKTLYARYAQALGRDESIPDDGYPGAYLVKMGSEVASQEGTRFLDMPREQGMDALCDVGLKKMLALIQDDLQLMGVAYDRWYSERSLYEDGLFDKVRSMLEERGYISRDREVSRGLKLTSAARAQVAPQAVVRLPLLGRIVAGEPIPVPASDFALMGDETIELTRDILGGAEGLYALQVEGNSMIDALVYDGDVVVMRYQGQVENGEMAAVWLKDREEVTLKHFYQEEGGRVRLQPANPTMRPIYVDDPRQVEVQGKVVMVIRQLD